MLTTCSSVQSVIARPRTKIVKVRRKKVTKKRKVVKKRIVSKRRSTKKKVTRKNKKRTPKLITFPKALQGKWYFGRHYYLCISKNTIIGSQFGYRRKAKVYQGNRSYLHYFNRHGHQIYFWKQGRLYYLTLVDSYPAKMYLTKRHGRRVLRVYTGIGYWANYYKSRYASKKYLNH